MSNLVELSKNLNSDDPVEAEDSMNTDAVASDLSPSNDAEEDVTDIQAGKGADTEDVVSGADDDEKAEPVQVEDKVEEAVSQSDQKTATSDADSESEDDASESELAADSDTDDASKTDDADAAAETESKSAENEDTEPNSAETKSLIPKPSTGGEKKKSGSLVERAASMSGSNPFNRPIGKIGEARRDPSSMNPMTPPPAPTHNFRGIGGSGGPKKPKTDDGDTPAPITSSAFGAVSPPEKKQSALERMANAAPAKPLVQKKERKAKPPQEIDLVALREAGYITPDMPPNLMSEEFRIIKRSLLLHAFSKGKARSKKSNVMLVTSSNPSEGKTFCTINLALSIATEQDITVLLIDADFSKPEILNRLGVNGGRGLMDVVADDNIDVGDCLIRTNVPNLVLLPAGRQHNLTTELLASERMETMVEEIATRYPDRLVIFDSPPVLASSAASVLALYMGQTVFVIEAEKTTEPQIKESLSMISSCENINLLLNKTRYNSSNQKFASYYGYGGR